ncbi:MAG: Na+/H+ antiporter subunit E [Candidatus Aminicenantales bacterium]
MEDKDETPGKNVRFPSRRLRDLFIRNNLILFVLLFGLWLLMSGHYDLFHISFGFLCSWLVILMNLRLNKYFFIQENTRLYTPLRVVRLLFYIPWLIWQIVVASLQVAAVVLNPRMPVDPSLVRFKTKLPNTASRVILANSITLTPGTITLELNEDEFLVHSLLEASSSSILDGSLPAQVARLYDKRAGQIVQEVEVLKTFKR